MIVPNFDNNLSHETEKTLKKGLRSVRSKNIRQGNNIQVSKKGRD